MKAFRIRVQVCLCASSNRWRGTVTFCMVCIIEGDTKAIDNLCFFIRSNSDKELGLQPSQQQAQSQQQAYSPECERHVETPSSNPKGQARERPTRQTKVGFIMQITMGTSPTESMVAAGNIFVGQTESPLLIRPYISKLTKSEIHAVMTAGFATIAGSFHL
ncbi:hypothetical protein UPYG_G00188300 [Umbra pygmaea]|uniref:Nucleoside transporter/FeoB GTPase Gate domain-containing protein n=1 Tax=Umbra pygmaea TaxID=75934 RepID=A0ABD0WWY6_UMBPY